MKKRLILVGLATVGVISTVVILMINNSQTVIKSPGTATNADGQMDQTAPSHSGILYVDNSREVTQLTKKLSKEGDKVSAALLNRISSQPGSTWLNGPTLADPSALTDIAEVRRTSQEAAQENTIPIYVLYAIPKRDACAQYSSGGFNTDSEYLQWIDSLIGALKSQAIMVIEPDAIAQTLGTKCFSSAQITARYELLRLTLRKFAAEPKVSATYLDAGHAEWFSNPAVLVNPLRKSGIELATGVSVNVSFFVATPETTEWSGRLVEAIGGNKKVLIDTSRNGRGVPPVSAVGEARWCNPAGRGLGKKPTMDVPAMHVDGYFWGKNVGESDGSCFGNPPAGTFILAAALEMAQNAEDF